MNPHKNDYVSLSDCGLMCPNPTHLRSERKHNDLVAFLAVL